MPGNKQAFAAMNKATFDNGYEQELRQTFSNDENMVRR
jgi:hypothetical protein